MRRAGIWLVMIAVAITGCATGQPGYYAYPQRGQTAEQFSRDQFECQGWAKKQTGYESGETARGAGRLSELRSSTRFSPAKEAQFTSAMARS